ncbi:hypothetical protein [Halopseudomonas aestusnigri]|uniref:hypothetical protein n=1 Tax=Halopseudomonas aestusnigri TaxID=857252 RepID=UPI0028C187D6|nr:hypothetical protein YSKK_34140 [Halopseudomonas aestusnigri]
MRKYVIGLKESVDLLTSSWRWWREQRNPVLLQARRLLETLDAHGVSCTEINALLPPALRLNAICWSSPTHLALALNQEHIEWANELFALNPKWLVGRSEVAHQLIDSYKSPQDLHHWFEEQEEHGHGRFRLYLITSAPTPYDQFSKAPYVVVLEELFDTVDDSLSRYYFLTAGAAFDHSPCVLHLMQILAIAHHHNVIMRRALVPEKDLWTVSQGEGLIPRCLEKGRGTVLNADHEFWGHFSGETPWLSEMRNLCNKSLLAAGLGAIVETVRRDRIRFQR